MKFRSQQIAPPKSWIEFEDLCHALFKAVWKDDLSQKNGRSGQPQYGVDIFGSPDGSRATFDGVQCKGKDQGYGAKATLVELKREIAKAEQFSPPLKHWVLATTAPSDAALQQAAREISAERHAAGQFTISVLGWEEIQALLAEQAHLIEEFYPQHAFNLPALISNLRAFPFQEVRELLDHVRDVRDNRDRGADILNGDMTSCWEPVKFDGARDLGPALLGRRLGPSDAAVCPRLAETDSVLGQLRNAYSVRLIGLPGAGKSVCAYQAALDLAQTGWQILRLRDPQASSDASLDCSSASGQMLYLVDDAHLLPGHVLKRLEDAARTDRILLTTHNATDYESPHPGSIFLDAKRAVGTIAAALRVNLADTIKVVRRADDEVGEHYLDQRIEDRIDHAERADRPWQFCFILGGGWRRAKAAGDSARAAGADITLAAVAIRQLATRDASATAADIAEMLLPNDLQFKRAQASIDWLLGQRLILAKDDCRCPHQRFASVVLHRILEGQDREGRSTIAGILQRVVGDKTYPLAGLRVVLHELRFSLKYVWTWLIPPKSLEPLVARCWASVEPEERAFASLVLSELPSYVKDWSTSIVSDHAATLSDWISHPVQPSGYAVGTLVNAVRCADEALARQIVSASDPVSVAFAMSSATASTAYHLAELVRGIGSVTAEQWREKWRQSIERGKLLELAAAWPESEPLFVFARFCQAVVWWDEELALDMAEKFLPIGAAAIARNPVEAFRDLDDIVSSVFRMFDVLHVYVGRRKPSARQRNLATDLCSLVNSRILASQISAITKRDFQPAAYFMSFLADVAPTKFKATVLKLDWEKIETVIGEDWTHPPHEIEIFLASMFADPASRRVVSEVLSRNRDRIVILPPRLVLLAPEVAFEHVATGRQVALEAHGHFDWRFGAGAVAIFAERRPDLLDCLLSPWLAKGGKALSQQHPSWYDDAWQLINVLKSASPHLMQQLIGAIDVAGAEQGWVASIRAGSKSRRTVALLVEESIARNDAIGEMAQRLRSRFPAASIPIQGKEYEGTSA